MCEMLVEAWGTYNIHCLYHCFGYFQAEKLNITFVSPKSGLGLLSVEDKEKVKATQEKNRKLLRIPRRLSFRMICWCHLSVFLHFTVFVGCMNYISLSIWDSTRMSKQCGATYCSCSFGMNDNFGTLHLALTHLLYRLFVIWRLYSAGRVDWNWNVRNACRYSFWNHLVMFTCRTK